MKYNPEKHHRKSIRLTGHDYSQTGAYFVTICTRDRECLFGDVIEKQMILNSNGNIAR
jgi:putative transposase